MGKPHFRAQFSLRGTEAGGRRTPVFSGYRPMLNFQPWESWSYCAGQLTLVGRERCAPGETCLADVELASPEALPVALAVGVRFLLCEGAQVVADAEVVDVYRP